MKGAYSSSTRGQEEESAAEKSWPHLSPIHDIVYQLKRRTESHDAKVTDPGRGRLLPARGCLLVVASARGASAPVVRRCREGHGPLQGTRERHPHSHAPPPGQERGGDRRRPREDARHEAAGGLEPPHAALGYRDAPVPPRGKPHVLPGRERVRCPA